MKNNRFIKDVWENFTSRLGGLLVAFIFSIAFSRFLSDSTGQIICGTIILALYSLPVYGTMWRMGNRDLNLFTFHHAKKDSLRGFKIGLVSSIPWFVMAFLFILSKFNLFYNITFIFKIASPEIVAPINLIERSMYMSEFTILELLGVAALTLVPAVLSGIYYLMGNRNLSPIQKIVYQKEKADQ